VYQLSLSDQNGCSFSDSVEIIQPESPLGGSTTKIDIGCYGDGGGEIWISGMGGTSPYRFALDAAAWNGSPKQIGLQAGIYIPRIQDKNGCEVDLSPVEILQRPPVQVDLGAAITINYGESAQLMAEVSGALEPVQYFWNAADSLWLSCLDCPDPFVDDLEFGRWFELTIVDSLGCTATSRVLVNVEKTRKVFVPSGFSPNGDGANDLLLAHGQSTTRVLDFQVYDRWGELVYEGGGFQLNDSNVGWDGTFRGQTASSGVYVWVLQVEYQDGVQETFRGSTTLIR
jgi:gliding motility-associated-like protein